MGNQPQSPDPETPPPGFLGAVLDFLGNPVILIIIMLAAGFGYKMVNDVGWYCVWGNSLKFAIACGRCAEDGGKFVKGDILVEALPVAPGASSPRGYCLSGHSCRNGRISGTNWFCAIPDG